MNRYIVGDLMKKNKRYVVSYIIPDDFSRQSSLSITICRGIDKEDVLRRLILQCNDGFYKFVLNFIFTYSQEWIDELNGQISVDELNSARCFMSDMREQYFVEYEKHCKLAKYFIDLHLEKIVYLLSLYSHYNTEYLRIDEYSNCLIENQGRYL